MREVEVVTSSREGTGEDFMDGGVENTLEGGNGKVVEIDNIKDRLVERRQ